MTGHHYGGKDLRDLHGLARNPLLSFLRRQTQPDTPRQVQNPPPQTMFEKLAAFASTNYAAWIWEYLRHRIGTRHPFVDYTRHPGDTGIYPLAAGDGSAEIRVALAGDWGTGTDEAFRVAELMRQFDPHFTIHLGDVYFVGDAEEMRENFMGEPVEGQKFTPCQWPAGSRGTFALNGNHEMFARGWAYFDVLLPWLAAPPRGGAHPQHASFFCLQNDHWRIIALDTAYNSAGWPILEEFWQGNCALPPPHLDWLAALLGTDDGIHRTPILLSHHQYFSAFDRGYPKPAEQLRPWFRHPVLWFWGHEHRLTIYEQYMPKDGLQTFGRCIGHGGMPVDLPGEVKEDGPIPAFTDARIYQNGENLNVGYNGFARLTFAGPRLTVDYVDIDDVVLFTETWQANGDGTITGVAHAEPNTTAAGAPHGDPH